jgi:hypothetical protein
MAKIHSIFELSGTMGNMTFVDSRAYDKHVRSRRGTHKPAVVNDSFRKSSDELGTAIPFSQRIKNSFNPYLTNFKDGTLWMRLVSFFRKQLRTGDKIDYRQLEGFQFHKKHSLDSLLRGKIGISASVSDGELSISIQLRGHPYFPVNYINAYCITLAVVSISADGITTETWDHVFPVTMMIAGQEMGEQILRFPAGLEMKTFIICLKCDGYQDAVIMNNARTKGMAVLKVVERE